jgi:predicted transcriptional regulator
MPQMANLSQQNVMGWGNNRGWIEIVEMILEICESGALKTHIMYKCNLNSKQIAQYTQFLTNHNLLESQINWPYKRRIIYKTTEMGKKYINAYKQIENIFK